MEEPFDNNKCNGRVYTHGVSIGLYDIPKETANSICRGIQALTGIEIDWHYVAGRVHIMVLPPADVPLEDLITCKSEQERLATLWGYVHKDAVSSKE